MNRSPSFISKGVSERPSNFTDEVILQRLKHAALITITFLFCSCASSQDHSATKHQTGRESVIVENTPAQSEDASVSDPESVPESASASVLASVLATRPDGIRDSTDAKWISDLPQLPPVSREFRGVWIATVKNTDWPSRQDLTSEEQKAELRSMLDRAKDLNLNAVIFQVRPTADAFYASALEPWSVFLNGKQGRAPDPYYDPLEFAILEAHARGLELHAWFNPFRADIKEEVKEYAENHVIHTEMAVRYGNYAWLDPGNPDARQHSLNVAMDIVERYDIDGFHMDDYFYPYPVASDTGESLGFPDDSSWNQSREREDGMDRDDWRRRNVDHFVRDLHEAIRSAKPWVKFGISPFGIWQPGYPDGIVGFNPHDKLYADSRKWLINGWVDYFTPQLYWAVDSPGQSYRLLLSWWIEQNQRGRHLWPGNFTSRITLTGERYWDAKELLDQIQVTRENPSAGGNTHFRMSSLMPAPHRMGEQLKEKFYQSRALIPESPWLRTQALPTPHLSRSADGKTITASLSDTTPADVKQWLFWELQDDIWDLRILPGGTTVVTFVVENPVRAVAVSVVDRIGRDGSVVYKNLSRP